MFHLPRLEFGSVWNAHLDRVDIRSQNVHSVEIRQWDCVIDLSSCVNLKRLQLGELSISDQLLNNLLSKLPALKFLCIDDWYVKVCEISSSCLEELKVHICDDWIDLNMDTPNLCCLTCLGSITSLSLTITSLWKIPVDTVSYGGWNALSQNCIDFLGKLGRLRAPNFRLLGMLCLSIACNWDLAVLYNLNLSLSFIYLFYFLKLFDGS